MVERQDDGAGPMIQADLRDGPKQTAIRAGNITLFIRTADNSFDTALPESDKKSYVGGRFPLVRASGKGARG
jgi:hypothetical protein